CPDYEIRYPLISALCEFRNHGDTSNHSFLVSFRLRSSRVGDIDVRANFETATLSDAELALGEVERALVVGLAVRGAQRHARDQHALRRLVTGEPLMHMGAHIVLAEIVGRGD